MNVTTTAGLLERGRAGDAEALSIMFDRHWRRLAILVHYKMGAELRQRFEVDDVVQETLLRACRDLEKFRYEAPGAFFRWLSAIATHVIADFARHENRQRRREEPNPGNVDPAVSLTPSRIVAQKERLQKLIAQLDGLPEDYREVVILAKMEGLSPQEIAERMGRTREQIAVLLHRAIKRLRAAAQS